MECSPKQVFDWAGFVQSDVDKTLYWLKKNGNFIILLAYVDDILMFSNIDKGIDKKIQQFKAKFETRKSDKIERFLRINIEHKEGSELMHSAYWRFSTWNMLM